jgi:hypothetical protein
MPTMPKKPSKDRHTKKRLVVWLNSQIRADLEELAERTERTMTAEFTRALRRHLREHGFPGYEERGDAID